MLSKKFSYDPHSHPQKNLFKRDSMEEIIPDETLKKERA